MKYRDLISVFAGIAFILSVAYTIGVNHGVWYVPAIIFIFIVLIIWKLWL